MAPRTTEKGEGCLYPTVSDAQLEAAVQAVTLLSGDHTRAASTVQGSNGAALCAHIKSFALFLIVNPVLKLLISVREVEQ